ncbi:heavy-metal-associated domain-containing protein [Microbacteriaceae bacterium K1510]|jgi:copper chaperone|nr:MULTISPECIES: heavy-metal-associated domain-containing protein [unclassified Microbacterium]MBN9152385.1 heavy-metal-associated domain-containing protein [Microbacterium sp.]MCK9913881.1 heavy-metal-associated domain-containing protein [Microbacteriaceae bacterium K1510]
MAGQEYQDLGLREASDGCACCVSVDTTTDASSAVAETVSAPVTAEYFVDGMTCSHCVRSVTEEVSAIEGVSRVDIDLRAGGVSTVTVASTAPVDPERVREAVEEAGYALAAVS